MKSNDNYQANGPQLGCGRSRRRPRRPKAVVIGQTQINEEPKLNMSTYGEEWRQREGERAFDLQFLNMQWRRNRSEFTVTSWKVSS